MEMPDIMQDKTIVQNVFTIQYCWHPESFLDIYRFHFGLTVNNVVKGVKTVQLIKENIQKYKGNFQTKFKRVLYFGSFF